MILLNSGIWADFRDGNDEAEHDAIIAVLAAAKRTNSQLRIIWKSTTQRRDSRKAPSFAHPSIIQGFVGKLVAHVGAEVFDAFAITESLGTTSDATLSNTAYYDFNHFGPAVHAHMGAALIAHLARGWV